MCALIEDSGVWGVGWAGEGRVQRDRGPSQRVNPGNPKGGTPLCTEGVSPLAGSQCWTHREDRTRSEALSRAGEAALRQGQDTTQGRSREHADTESLLHGPPGSLCHCQHCSPQRAGKVMCRTQMQFNSCRTPSGPRPPPCHKFSWCRAADLHLHYGSAFARAP